jgi:hypothetical protein
MEVVYDLRNVGNTAHIHTMQRLKSRINANITDIHISYRVLYPEFPGLICITAYPCLAMLCCAVLTAVSMKQLPDFVSEV